MLRTAIAKLLHLLVVLCMVSFALAFLLELSPNDPAYAVLGERATDEQIARVRADLNLGDPVHVRYLDWITGVVQGDFGTSYRTGQSVSTAVLERLPVTLQLITFSMIITLAIAVPVGVWSAYRARGRFDRIWQSTSSVLVSVPPFVSALLLVFLFSIQLRNTPFALPATGWAPISDGLLSNMHYLILPAVALALAEIPAFTRVLRADMIATLQEDYILAAKSRGVPTGRILLRHALRPSSFSLVTLAALSIGRLMGGAVIVESVFALPGVGQLIVANIVANDVIMVQGIVMIIAIAYVTLNSLTDLAYRYLDPRIRAREA